VGSGANAQDYADTFNVMAADPRLLISLADAKAGLGITGTSKDEDIRSVIAAATPIMEDLCGPILRTTRTETYDGGTTQINLLWSPLISITSIIESYGSTYVRTLTQQDVFSGSGLDSFGFSVDLTTGIVTLIVDEAQEDISEALNIPNPDCEDDPAEAEALAAVTGP